MVHVGWAEKTGGLERIRTGCTIMGLSVVISMSFLQYTCSRAASSRDIESLIS